MAVDASRLEEVEVEALDAARFEPLVGPERMAGFEAGAGEGGRLRGGAGRDEGATRRTRRVERELDGRRRWGRRDAPEPSRVRARRRRRRPLAGDQGRRRLLRGDEADPPRSLRRARGGGGARR